MATIFVTGGAGFIGSAFIRFVLEETFDTKIINYDALTYAGNLENLKELDEKRHKFVKGDIRDKQAVLQALPEKIEAVFNFAAETHVDRSINSAEEFVTTNVLGTQILLDAARTKNVKRFVHISTDEVMGSLPEDDTTFFTEDSPLQPNSPYAASKAAAEHLVRAAHETFGLDTIITRCGNNYGPRQFPEKLIPLIIANAINDELLPVYGDGKNTRDWIYVEDHARVIWLTYAKGAAGGIYNIGARNERTNLEVVKSILDILGKPHSLIKFVADRLGHDRRYAIDPTKAETELEWKSSTPWEEGLRKTIRWYAENQNWVKQVRSGAYRDYYKNLYGLEIKN
ncbi:MAG TPA: dTDP-glucose 4,6-dehydratase [Pyrinomonadaceae bacterium]|jgi:dTDP-glucose 4,6-dehydratase